MPTTRPTPSARRPLSTASLLAAVLFATQPSTGAAAATATPADLLIENARVLTPQGWRGAIAVRDGIVVAIGDGKELAALRGPRTRMLDAGGDDVLPGLHDTHVHPQFAGLEQYSCGIAPGAGPDAIAAAVKACAAARKPGEWITGGNWVAAVFAPGQQNRQFLDAVAPAQPVVLSDEAHHSVWVNSKALELAGITRATPDPAGGIIERGPDGEPNGLLRETATSLVEKFVPPPTEAERRAALELAANQMLSFGITSFTIASIRPGEIQSFAALSEEGVIRQRMRGCMVWAPPGSVDAGGEDLITQRAHYARPRFATDCVKMFLDGVPTESHTGAMVEPYSDAKPGDPRPPKGILMMPQEVLDATVTRFDRAGLHIKFHAAGDAAVRAAIDAVLAARKANGWGGPMHDVGHCTFVHADDIPRVRAAHMAFEFSPYIWYPTPMASLDVAQAVGAARMERWVPIREALETGALVTAGSDWSVVPSVNPWLAMETLVTREQPGGSRETLGKDERITLAQAFRVFTENGAELAGQRESIGAIEVGMRADLIQTAGDPFTVPITQLHETRVKRVFIDGEQVFDSAKPPRLTAR